MTEFTLQEKLEEMMKILKRAEERIESIQTRNQEHLEYHCIRLESLETHYQNQVDESTIEEPSTPTPAPRPRSWVALDMNVRWLGTININTKVMVKLVVSMKTPRSGVSGLVDEEVGGIGGKVGGVDMSVHGLLPSVLSISRLLVCYEPPSDVSMCHGPECSGSRRAPVESMAVVQSPWRPWTPTDSHAKEERAHMRGGPAKKRTKLKEHADGYHSGARETRAKGTVTGQGGGAVSKEPTQLRRTGVVLESPPVQYSMKRVLSGERAGAASLVTL
ncbi:uncharacterized protein UDID_17166 [Ustilago sp. UG-2017a]|nr:uncharacterized protein UDID_17166 [Ustilago sp. UG-2017a]